MEERNPIIILTGALTLILLALFTWMLSSGKVGLIAPQLENAARKTQQVDSSWQMIKSEDGPLTVFLFYSEDQDDYTYALYQNPPGFSFGHFFVSGGTVPAIGEGVLTVATSAVQEGYSVVLSMNTPGVSRIELTRISTPGGDPATVITVNPAEPFSLVLPAGVGDKIALYDAQGQSIPSVGLVIADSDAA